MVIKMEKSRTAVHGAVSTKGMEMVPQESPATICWNKVRAAAKMPRKPSGHRSQSSQVMPDVMGCNTSTEITAQKVITDTSISACRAGIWEDLGS